MNFHRIITAGFAVCLGVTAVVGGIHGNEMDAQAQAEFEARENVTAFIVQAEANTQAHAGAQALDILTTYQPSIDTATALIESSAGKASDASRDALAALVAEYNTKTTAHAASGTDALAVATSTVATATPAIEAASTVVTEEVAAWQAEQDRIAAEAAAAEAAKEAERSRGGYSNGGGSSSNNGSSNGGGGSNDGRAWAENIIYSIAPNVSNVVWDYAPVAGSYGGMHRGGVIYLSNRVADGSGYAYSILVHEATHAGPQRGSCYDTWKGHFGGDAERFTQAYTLANFGTTVDAYAYPTSADLAAAGSC